MVPSINIYHWAVRYKDAKNQSRGIVTHGWQLELAWRWRRRPGGREGAHSRLGDALGGVPLELHIGRSQLLFGLLGGHGYILGAAMWNRELFFTVPVPTLEKLWFRFRFQLLKSYGFGSCF
jgi:hypothetical protein